MPKFSGTDLIKHIRASPTLKSIPVIILSEVSIGDLAQEAISIGAERVFLKSRCTPAALVGAIRQLVHDDAPEALFPPAFPVFPPSSSKCSAYAMFPFLSSLGHSPGQPAGAVKQRRLVGDQLVLESRQ